MQINITWDTSVNAAPEAFKTDVLAVAQDFAARFTDPVSVNVAVGFGEVGGTSMGNAALGASLTYFTPTSYASLRGALTQDAATGDDLLSAHTLPGADPTHGGQYWATTAQAKALGLSAGTGVDGYVGLSSTAAFDFDNTDGVTAGSYDFFGVVAHEFSEVMGRQLLAGETLGGTPNSYDALDLFHWSAPNVRDLTGSTAGYFSLDQGATNLDNFNTNPAGDYGDWSSTAGNDAFDAFSRSGVVNQISEADLKALDVIGWNRGSGTAVAANAVANSASHASVSTAYAGSHEHGPGYGYYTDAAAGVPSIKVADLDFFFGV